MPTKSFTKDFMIDDDETAERLFDVLHNGTIEDHMQFALNCLGYGFVGRNDFIQENVSHFANPEDAVGFLVTNYVTKQDTEHQIGDKLTEQQNRHILDLTGLIIGCNLDLQAFADAIRKITGSQEND